MPDERRKKNRSKNQKNIQKNEKNEMRREKKNFANNRKYNVDSNGNGIKERKRDRKKKEE